MRQTEKKQLTNEQRVLGYLGIAARARMIESGEFSTEKAVRTKRAALVITAADASDNTKKNFRNLCDYYGVPYCEYASKDEIGHAIGKTFRASCAITDEKLAEAVRNVIGSEQIDK